MVKTVVDCVKQDVWWYNLHDSHTRNSSHRIAVNAQYRIIPFEVTPSSAVPLHNRSTTVRDTSGACKIWADGQLIAINQLSRHWTKIWSGRRPVRHKNARVKNLPEDVSK